MISNNNNQRMTQEEIIKLAVEAGASTAEMRGMVVDVFFEPRDLARFVHNIIDRTKGNL